MTPDERVQAARDAAKSFAPAWAALLAAAYATIGKAAGDTLYSQWKADGLIPTEAQYANAAASSDGFDALIHDKADAIASTTHDRLDAALSAALAVGTTAALLDALHSMYGAWTGSDDSGGSRADVIGTTEGNTAWHLGQQDGVTTASKDYGVTGTQTWNAVMDAATREAHADADGQTVPLGETFSVGGEDLYYPGGGGDPANNINCRCWITYDGVPVGAEEP